MAVKIRFIFDWKTIETERFFRLFFYHDKLNTRFKYLYSFVYFIFDPLSFIVYF